MTGEWLIHLLIYLVISISNASTLFPVFTFKNTALIMSPHILNFPWAYNIREPKDSSSHAALPLPVPAHIIENWESTQSARVQTHCPGIWGFTHPIYHHWCLCIPPRGLRMGLSSLPSPLLPAPTCMSHMGPEDWSFQPITTTAGIHMYQWGSEDRFSADTAFTDAMHATPGPKDLTAYPAHHCHCQNLSKLPGPATTDTCIHYPGA